MRFFTDEYRCPAHAADVAAALSTLGRAAGNPRPAERRRSRGGQPCRSRATIFAEWMGLDPRLLSTGTMALSGTVRPGRVVLDSTLGGVLRSALPPLAETLRRHRRLNVPDELDRLGAAHRHVADRRG